MVEGGLVWLITFYFTWFGWPVLVHSLGEKLMVPGCAIGRMQAGGGCLMLWAMFCWATLGPGNHLDVTLSHTIYLNVVADQVHPFMATLFPDASFGWIMGRIMSHCRNSSGMVWETGHPQISIQWRICGMYWKKFDSWRLHLTPYRSIYCQCLGDRFHWTPSEVMSMSMPRQVSCFGGTYTLLGSWF